MLCHLNNRGSWIVDRGSWGRWREFVVELTRESKLGPANQNTAGSGASLKDLNILARGCHGTWLPRVTVPDRTQSCRDCIGRGRGACAGRRISYGSERGPCGMVRPRRGSFSRTESKPGPPDTLPSGMKRSWGARTRGSQRFAWQPRARVCTPFRNGSAGRLECAGGSWIVGPFGQFVIEPPSEAIAVPASHTSGCVANDFISICRSQSLFVAVTKH